MSKRVKIEDKLTEAPQYHFARDLFCNVFAEVFGNDFMGYDLFYDVEYKSFDLWHIEDTWYIYWEQFDVAICWYKHLGRINQCTNEFLTLEGLRTLFIALKEEYDEGKNVSKRAHRMNVCTLIEGDCLNKLKTIATSSVDFILCDLPYGTTQNTWDCLIPLNPLWEEYNRVLKPNGCCALFAQSPFDKVLACSNLKNYRYEWIIEKTKASGHLNAKKMPMKAHENILIFYRKLPVYHPQTTEGHSPVHNYTKHTDDGLCYGKTRVGIKGGGSTLRYPRDVLKFSWDTQKSSLHPTQKPVALLEYMIKTYTNEGDTVLDSCMGSGSTGVACIRTKRRFIGIELDSVYYSIACRRIENE